MGDVLELSEDSDWYGKFENLPIKDDEGKEYEYGFVEDDVKGCRSILVLF